jgi:hypothetical protein
MLIDYIYKQKRKDIKKIDKLEEFDKKTLERIFTKVNIDKNNLETLKESCWIYGKNNKISKKGSGHSQIYFKGNKNVMIHRLMYHNFIENVPKFDNKTKKFQVNHKCSHENNGKCINPWHMYLGSNKDNIKDSKMENTFTAIKHPGWGQKHHNSNFTNEQVEQMKEMRISGKTYQEIGKCFKTSPSYVSEIYRGVKRKKG